MTHRGEDISPHLRDNFTVMRPAVQRINVDFSAPMLEELGRKAGVLNMSRQAVIRTMISDGLDRRYLAKQALGVG